MTATFQRIGHFKQLEAFRSYLQSLGLALPMDERILSAAEGSPLAQSLQIGPLTVGNRWCIHPMEGWDGTADGKPSDHTLRRWRHFGASGAKLIWGGEAFAVQHEGRANPRQLCYRPENKAALAGLLSTLLEAHRARCGSADGLVVGLQLTHSGRYSKPNAWDQPEPRIAYHHPLLDRRVGIRPGDDAPLLSDDDLQRLIESYITAARLAWEVGFQFVDVKHCHGYLGHELLSAYDRPGKFGGDLMGRTRFLRQIVAGIRAACPKLLIGVRLSLFDFPPFHPDAAQSTGGKLGPGVPDEVAACLPYPGFGCRRDRPFEIDLTEPIQLLKLMRDELKIEMVNLTAGSPYYNPHIQRPAYFPPSDGYQPPEDPLIGCLRQIEAAREVKKAVPGLPMVGTAYTYFQEYLPHIAQAVVREGWTDFVGLGRMVLAYPELPFDTLTTGSLPRAQKLCRTFSDCTTAPRSGIISGCYPLDEHYKSAPQAQELKVVKVRIRERLKGQTS